MRVRVLPCCAERLRHTIHMDVVCASEMTVGQTAQQHALTVAQNYQISDAIAINVKRIGTVYGREIRHVIARASKPERAAHRRFVAKQRRRTRTTGNVQIGLAITVAIENCHAAANLETGVAVIYVIHTRRRRFLDEMWGTKGRFGRHAASYKHDRHTGDRANHHKNDVDPKAPVH